MKKILLVTCSILVAAVAAGQAPIDPPVKKKASAREQIESALPLTRSIERAKDPSEKQLAMLKALSQLEVVPRAWPHDREAIFRAGLLEADVFARNNSPRNALEVLDRIEAAAVRPTQKLQIAGIRGAALTKLGRVDEAAAVFETALAMRVEAPRDRMPILTDAATFYFFQKRNAELSRVLRESAALDPSPLSAAMSIVQSLEANMRNGNLSEARKDYADLAERYERLQRLPVAPFGGGEAAALRDIRDALDRFRSLSS